MHVAFDRLRFAENFAANRIAEDVRVQTLPEARAFRQFEDAAVVNDAGADIAALQRNDPDPPAGAKKVISCPFSRGATLIRVVGKTLAPFVAVPFLDAAE